MGHVELFPFRFRDPVTGKWIRARYRAELREIAQRYADYVIIGPPEIRDSDPDAPRFTPYVERPAPTLSDNGEERPPQFQPHLAKPPAIDRAEAILLQLFLRRYITYCARCRRFAALNGAARLFTEVKGALTKAAGIDCFRVP